jgi:DNA-binding transcriptional LysR family regulator
MAAASMINQQWLHTFITLVEVGHFTLTGDKLHMTQPGVSQHIKKLEEQLGVLLLNRIGKRFEVTREGEVPVWMQKKARGRTTLQGSTV